VLLTVILQQDGHPAPLAAVRLGMDDVAKLRQLAGFARGCAQAEERRYDCRTTGQRIADLEQRVKGLTTALGICASSATVQAQSDQLTALDERLTALQQTCNRLVLFAGSDQEVKDLLVRLTALEVHYAN
jgi:hypothetical protein